MRSLGVVLLASVGLGGVFGTATVEGTPVDDESIEIDISVEGPPQTSVVAHLILPGGPQQTVALAERRFGVHGAVVEVPRADLVVVFEAIGEGQSEPVTLTRLGLDPAVLGLSDRVEVSEQGPSTATRRWGWLGLALGSGALALLAVWALGGGARAEDDDSRPQVTSA